MVCIKIKYLTKCNQLYRKKNTFINLKIVVNIMKLNKFKPNLFVLNIHRIYFTYVGNKV